jgi:hypothetical protein
VLQIWLVPILSAIAVLAQPAERRAPAPLPPSGPGPREIERFLDLPEERRQAMLDRLPPARRKAFRERIDRYQSLSPEERSRLRESFDRFRRMPADDQDRVRQALREVARMDRERRFAVRREVDSLRRMNPSERLERFESSDFAAKFSPREQRVIRELDALAETTGAHF